MMKTFGKLAIAGICIAGLGVQAFAVSSEAVVSDTKSTQENRETLVSKILAEGKENNLDCKQLVTKLDIEIIELDLKLDQGAKNEEELLAERESLVGCRLSQPCHAEVVTPVAPCCGHAVEICTCEQPIEIIEETILCEEEILVEEPLAAAPMMGCGYGSSCGMGGGGGGGGMGGLALAGLAGLAGLDDDDNVVYVRP